MAGKKGLLGTDFSKIRALVVLCVDVILVVALVLLLQIDKLVNSTFYGYGLTFSTGWAEPYWTMFRSTLILIVIAIIIISAVELPYPSFENKKMQDDKRKL
jgi:uncharacterized membrane protein